jgi:hypothetical protein
MAIIMTNGANSVETRQKVCVLCRETPEGMAAWQVAVDVEIGAECTLSE